jgi:hypothetical protein
MSDWSGCICRVDRESVIYLFAGLESSSWGNESVGEGTVLRCFRSPTGIGFLVAVIRVLGRCRAMESEVLLIEVEEQVRVSRDLVGSIEVLSI